MHHEMHLFIIGGFLLSISFIILLFIIYFYIRHRRNGERHRKVESIALLPQQSHINSPASKSNTVTQPPNFQAADRSKRADSQVTMQPANNGRQLQRNSSIHAGLPTTRRERRIRVPHKANNSVLRHNYEPLSMLQRLTEDFDYSALLDKASECTDAHEQLVLIAAFCVSTYCSCSDRTTKPFTPLLGETFECDRQADLGWRAISEQVSQSPPTVVQYCEGRSWHCWQEFTMTAKFTGSSVQITPLGLAKLDFDNSANRYTWGKVLTTIHNVVFGSLWVDPHGSMDIVNHKTGDSCRLKLTPYSLFGRGLPRQVHGCVVDRHGKAKWLLRGTWDAAVEIAPVLNTEGTPDNPVFQTGAHSCVWRRRSLPPESEGYYNFTELAAQLNEEERGVAPTDSRNRRDMRLLENGAWDQANIEKQRLEDRQRQHEADAEQAAADGLPYPAHKPVWFRRKKDASTGSVFHAYTHRYWESKVQQDWSSCPDIF